MWAGALSYLINFPSYSKIGQSTLGDSKLLLLFDLNKVQPIKLMANARLHIALIVSFTLLLAFMYTRRLLGTNLAVVGFLLIAFDPFHIAHSQFLHTNGLLATFMFLALLAFIDWIQSQNKLSLVVSGSAAGLSYLCISPGFMLIPAAGLISLLSLWEHNTRRFQFDWKSFWQRIILPLLIWGAISLLIMFLLWPAMWVSPIRTMLDMLNYGFDAAEGGIGGAHFVEAYDESAIGKKFLHFYPLSYFWRSTPASFLGMLLGIFFLFFRRKSIDKNNLSVLIYLLVFVVTYTLLMSLGTKKYDRYLLPIYLPLNILAAWGWLCLGSYLKSLLPAINTIKLETLLPAIIIGSQLWGAIQSSPYYLSYYNALGGGIQKAQQIMTIGWGDGLNEAALWLRQQPGACDKRIISWYPLVFSWYAQSFKCGAELVEYDYKYALEDYLRYDYAIIYINQVQRNFPADLLEYLEHSAPVHTVNINGIDYLWIYKLK